jgi:hypothetical protein
MKNVSRFGAVLSFTFCAIPGLWLILHSNSEAGAVLFGMFLIGIAFFAGSMVWLTGERHRLKQDGK